MTRRDFEAIAAAVRDYLPPIPEREAFAHALAAHFAAVNPRFDKTRFLAACGVDA